MIAGLTMNADTLVRLYELRAGGAYGLSAVSQLEHALQAAAGARAMAAPASLVVAALLHDVGHLFHDEDRDLAAEGVDDRHEVQGAAWLAQRFPASVSEPIRLHVAAKRFLVATEPDYAARLSPDSVRSLALQGGPMTPAQCRAFRAETWWRDAVALRRLDEAAKVPGAVTPGLRDFLPMIAATLDRPSPEVA